MSNIHTTSIDAQHVTDLHNQITARDTYTDATGQTQTANDWDLWQATDRIQDVFGDPIAEADHYRSIGLFRRWAQKYSDQWAEDIEREAYLAFWLARENGTALSHARQIAKTRAFHTWLKCTENAKRWNAEKWAKWHSAKIARIDEIRQDPDLDQDTKSTLWAELMSTPEPTGYQAIQWDSIDAPTHDGSEMTLLAILADTDCDTGETLWRIEKIIQDETDRRIVAGILHQLTMRQIADTYHLNRKTVSRRLKAIGQRYQAQYTQ